MKKYRKNRRWVIKQAKISPGSLNQEKCLKVSILPFGSVFKESEDGWNKV